ncbi:hypothetical protein J3E68DRAFT_420303 [Trichoderma sp. SZMC 28012]
MDVVTQRKDMGSDFMYLFILVFFSLVVGCRSVLACATLRAGVGLHVCGFGTLRGLGDFVLFLFIYFLFCNWFVLHYVGRIHDARQEA